MNLGPAAILGMLLGRQTPVVGILERPHWLCGKKELEWGQYRVVRTGVVRAVTRKEIVRHWAGQVGVHAVNAATAVPGADSLMRLNVRKELGMTQAAAEGRWWHQ